MEQNNKEITYAGFFTRLLATLVDIVIVLFIMDIVRFVIDAKSIVLLVVVWWLYTTVMLIKWRATVGGKIFGIEILNSEYESLSFKSASLRFFISIVPFLLYVLLRGMQHDMILAPSPTVQQLPQLLFLLPPLLMFFTKKKQMIHDLIVQSIVVDTSEPKCVNKKGKMSVGYTAQKILRTGGTFFLLLLFGYLVLYVSVFYTLGKQSYDANNASYEKKYTVNDYNDSRIIFYNQELERSSKQFVTAESMYDIFEAQVKKALSLNCIEYFLAHEHNESNWIEMGSGFRKNARNKFAKSKEKIKKAKMNESYIGKHFYDYDLNDVRGIVDNIADKWEKDANAETCQKMLPVDQMYSIFIMRYIENREKTLSNNKWEYKNAKPTGALNKSFYKKEIEKTSSWLETLYAMNPDYKEYAKKKDEAFMKRREYYRIELEKRMNLWNSAQTGITYQPGYFDGVDANMRNKNGETPLIAAVKNGYAYVVSAMEGIIVDVHAKDFNGQTAFDYIKHPYYKYDKAISDRMYVSLRVIEVSQIVRGKGRIDHYEYSKDTNTLKIVIADSKCSEFTFPENTQCTIAE